MICAFSPLPLGMVPAVTSVSPNTATGVLVPAWSDVFQSSSPVSESKA